MGTQEHRIKQLEDELKKAKEKICVLSNFQEECYTPIIRISTSGLVLYSNIAALPILREWKVKQGQSFSLQLMQQYPEIFNQNKVTKYIKIDFKHFAVGFTIVPIPETEDAILYGNEIDHIKTLEEHLAEREKQFHSLIENSKTILFCWKFEGLWPVKFVSQNIMQFGYHAEEFMSGKINYSSIIHPDDFDIVLKEARQNISKKLKNYEQEYRIITRDGNIKWVLDRTIVKD